MFVGFVTQGVALGYSMLPFQGKEREESPDFTSGANKNPRLTAGAISNGAIHRTLLNWFAKLAPLGELKVSGTFFGSSSGSQG